MDAAVLFRRSSPFQWKLFSRNVRQFIEAGGSDSDFGPIKSDLTPEDAQLLLAEVLAKRLYPAGGVNGADLLTPGRRPSAHLLDTSTPEGRRAAYQRQKQREYYLKRKLTKQQG